MLPSELTNTIEQFIVYVHRNEAHVHLHLCLWYQCTWGWEQLKKTSPKYHFTYIFCHFYFSLGLHPWLCWLLERSQIPSCPRQLQTCARLMQGWVASAGWDILKHFYVYRPTKILATPVPSLLPPRSPNFSAVPVCSHPLLFTPFFFHLAFIGRVSQL